MASSIESVELADSMWFAYEVAVDTQRPADRLVLHFAAWPQQQDHTICAGMISIDACVAYFGEPTARHTVDLFLSANLKAFGLNKTREDTLSKCAAEIVQNAIDVLLHHEGLGCVGGYGEGLKSALCGLLRSGISVMYVVSATTDTPTSAVGVFDDCVAVTSVSAEPIRMAAFVTGETHKAFENTTDASQFAHFFASLNTPIITKPYSHPAPNKCCCGEQDLCLCALESYYATTCVLGFKDNSVVPAILRAQYGLAEKVVSVNVPSVTTYTVFDSSDCRIKIDVHTTPRGSRTTVYNHNLFIGAEPDGIAGFDIVIHGHYHTHAKHRTRDRQPGFNIRHMCTHKVSHDVARFVKHFLFVEKNLSAFCALEGTLLFELVNLFITTHSDTLHTFWPPRWYAVSEQPAFEAGGAICIVVPRRWVYYLNKNIPSLIVVDNAAELPEMAKAAGQYIVDITGEARDPPRFFELGMPKATLISLRSIGGLPAGATANEGVGYMSIAEAVYVCTDFPPASEAIVRVLVDLAYVNCDALIASTVERSKVKRGTRDVKKTAKRIKLTAPAAISLRTGYTPIAEGRGGAHGRFRVPRVHL